jgi:hypothetical protein
MPQHRNGRRGAVFPIRLTDEDRIALQKLQQALGGPVPLGPWLIWHALHRGNTGVRGNTLAIALWNELGHALHVPGTTRAARSKSASGITRPGASGITLPRHENASGNTRSSGNATQFFARGNTRAPRKGRIILDLCGGTGAWSEPYRAAGFRIINVTLPKYDVRTYVPPANVYGVLAAPPCTEFSLAKNGQRRDYVKGLEVVAACMRIIARSEPAWWALENPVGMLQKWMGTPRLVFEPYQYGDPWKKRTAIWGTFEMPIPGPYVKPLGSGPFCGVCDPTGKRHKHCRNAAHRAVTPSGFARAFFEANQ